MLDSGSEFGDGTQTIVFATLENLGSASWNFPVGLVRGFTPFWSFFGWSSNTANYRPIGVELCSQKYFSRMHNKTGYKLRPSKSLKNHVVIFPTPFFEKNVKNLDENFQKIDNLTNVFTTYSHLTYLRVISMFFCTRWLTLQTADLLLGPSRNSTKILTQVKK